MIELFEYQEFLLSLTATSMFTGLVTEALKKIFDENKWKYKSNTLAGIVSILVSLLGGIVWCVRTGHSFDFQCVSTIGILMLCTWLCSMVGYDKVVQTINQMKKG